MNSPEVAERSRAVFSFEETAPGVHAATSTFKFDPGRLLVSSPFGELDYCFVWIDGAPHEQFGTIEFWRGSFMAGAGAPANIIHHPKGLPKRASLEKNKVVDLGFAEVLVHYSSDTEQGSSGSPVLNDDWRLFALHHASTRELKGPKRDLLEKANIQGDILNEGIKTAAIAIDIDRRVNVGPDQVMARQVQAHIAGSDSRTGFFGTLGRHGQGSNGMEIVVDTYQGAAGDIDIAFWNVEWFNRDFERKVNDVARIVADLNLDIWAFEETSPEATEALVVKMRHEFDLDFEFAASEPNASPDKQTTTIMWNTRTVNGSRMEWPAEIDRLMHLRSDDPEALQFEAVDGKIFNRYPGLFRFELRKPSPNQQQFDFNLVPVHLKAKAEGAKRRRMASNLLATAIQMMTREAGSETDWIIGGDVNAELSTGQFDGLSDAGFSAMSAQDEQGGAITYLGARFRSLIDSIFLSPGLSRGVGADDFMIIAAERDDPGFIDRVSDHRPVMVRLSLGGAPPADGVSGPGGAGDALGEDEKLLNEFLNELRGDPAGTLEGLAKLIRNR
ncbi:MAG: trypsin-like peptidase domain-containing protein [Pseudomonadota bacterium]